MDIYAEKGQYKLYHGNMLDMLDVIEAESVDSIVTDPPYELNFMNKGWDNSGVAFQKGTWEKCFKVLKPGGYLLAFGGSRTFHRIACAIEDAGFEIRDTIMWLYGSGFPKSMNIGLAIDKKNGVESIDTGEKINSMSSLGVMHDDNWKSKKGITRKISTNEWQGWGTALKPAYEPVIVARKPCEGSCVDNVMKYGVGGINIDECRVGTGTGNEKPKYKPNNKNNIFGKGLGDGEYENTNGRFPANTILTYDETDFDEVCGGFPNTKSTGGSGDASKKNTFANTYNGGLGDEGSASRYFYCAKASKRDRDEGLNMIPQKCNDGRNKPIDNAFQRGETLRKNTHPTVKPTSLMQYLVRLVTPKGGVVLDPFNGSGSTGKAVMYENKDRCKNYKYIGIELTEEYLPISKARIEYVCGLSEDDIEDETKSFIENDDKDNKSVGQQLKLF